jgi:homoserine dehydrogenase
MPATTLAPCDGAAPETFCSSGTSPTLHLLGPGRVGRTFLARCAALGRLVAVTDSTATVCDRNGLDPIAVAAWKETGRPLAEHPGGARLPVELALDLVSADVVVDATATGRGPNAFAAARGSAVLRRGQRLVLAAKDGLCAALAEWLAPALRARLGIAAVLGGTGGTLLAELDELRLACRSVALVANATVTTVIEALEAGRDVEAGLAAARARGYVEADAELDLSGADAAQKLAIVVGALRGVPVDPAAIATQDVRTLDPGLVRARAVRGVTTRQVARCDGDSLRVSFEQVAHGAPLAAPRDRVVYSYALGQRRTRVHVGAGLGAAGTAAALAADVRALARAGGAA